ncbi:MAG: hypothetical protein HOG05_09545 [Bacteroidetes bacterium]|nr:hypothetical protein [Bacteroidota bacterium]
MKTNLNIVWLFAILITSCSNLSKPTKNQVKLSVQYEFINISDGFDHDTKTIIKIDGKQGAESSQHKESQKQTIKLIAPKGQHQIEIMNYALYKGIWEEHTVENNYSQDCLYQANMDLKDNTLIKLTFDLNEGTSVEIR